MNTGECLRNGQAHVGQEQLQA